MPTFKSETSSRVVGVVLAAGASRRLGRPKQLLSYDDKTLIAHAVAQLGELVSNTWVVVGAHLDKIMPAVSALPVTIIHNEHWSEGMASSIRAAVAHADQEIDAMLIMTCDQPTLGINHLATLRQRWQANPEHRVATDYGNGVVGVPAVFPATDFEALSRLQGDRGARGMLTEAATVLCPEAATDIDTEADYQNLLRR